MKKYFYTLLFAMMTSFTFAQGNYQLSSHILDISKGMPAKGVTIKLEKLQNDNVSWTIVDQKTTDSAGRVGNFLPADKSNPGIYRLTFLTQDYFKESNTESFYPFIEVDFEIKDDKHYHVPITLSAFGYSTYRGN